MLHDTEAHEIWPSCGSAAILLLLAEGGALSRALPGQLVSVPLSPQKGQCASKRGFRVTTWFNRSSLLFKEVSGLPVSNCHIPFTSGTHEWCWNFTWSMLNCVSHRAVGVSVWSATSVAAGAMVNQLAEHL